MLGFLTNSCSITKNLPEDEVLYTGYKIEYTSKPKAPDTDNASSQIASALQKTPSTKMFKFIPIPMGMWIYNDFIKYEKGLGKFIFNKLAAKPVFISTVNPDIRTKIATNLLHDFGYFNGMVNYKIITNPKDSLKASIVYSVNMKEPYFVDTLYYMNFAPNTMKIIDSIKSNSLVYKGEQFSVSSLDKERNRVSNALRNNGFFYFRPDYITYQADTVQAKDKVALRMVPVDGLPAAAQKVYYVGNTSINIYGRGGEKPNDSTLYNGINIHYYDKLKVRPKMLYRWIHTNDKIYSQSNQQKIQQKIAETGIFSYMNLQYSPKDTLPECDTLDLVLQAALAKPLDAELEFNIVTKSTSQTGPSASFSLTKNNVFGGGETWNVKLKGSYLWQTGGNSNGAKLNSWEMGIETSLKFPRIIFPWLHKKEYEFPASSSFKIYIEQLNRAKYYKLLAFGGNVTYDFQTSNVSKFSLSPINLKFNLLQHESEEFKQIAQENPSLYISLQNQFIPAMNFTYTYDNSSNKSIRNTSWWQTSITPAGNLLSCVYAIFGEPFDKQNKGFLGSSFAQFVKVTSEYRYLINVDKNNAIATRIGAGTIFSYGNKTIAPYSEQFYIGGANNVRAFTARSIGPGGTEPQKGKFGYLDQTGSMRLEANIEWRFRIYGDLWGATFLDAGNVWLLRNDPSQPLGQFKLKDFAKQIALGTGLGVRYDLQFLVFRVDIGVPLHAPYETYKHKYYNITGSFWKNLCAHFAVGYPF